MRVRALPRVTCWPRNSLDACERPSAYACGRAALAPAQDLSCVGHLVRWLRAPGFPHCLRDGLERVNHVVAVVVVVVVRLVERLPVLLQGPRHRTEQPGQVEWLLLIGHCPLLLLMNPLYRTDVILTRPEGHVQGTAVTVRPLVACRRDAPRDSRSRAGGNRARRSRRSGGLHRIFTLVVDSYPYLDLLRRTIRCLSQLRKPGKSHRRRTNPAARSGRLPSSSGLCASESLPPLWR